MAIHTTNHAVEPSMMASLSRAIEEACEALHIPARDRRSREVVTERIFDLMREGLTEPDSLRDKVVAEAQLKL